MSREPGQRERRLDSGPRWLLLVMERVCSYSVFFGCSLIPSLPRTAAAVKLGPGGISHRHHSPLPGVHTAGQQPQSLDQRAQVCGATSTWTRLNAHTPCPEVFHWHSQVLRILTPLLCVTWILGLGDIVKKSQYFSGFWHYSEDFLKCVGSEITFW